MKKNIVRKHFCCRRFRLLLDFSRNGGVTGKFFPFVELPTVNSDISGMHLDLEKYATIAFTCDFYNPNLEGSTQLFFSGEVFNYDGQRECLVVKWLAKQNFGWCEICERDIEILVDSTLEDERVELKKIREHLNLHPLHMMN